MPLALLIAGIFFLVSSIRGTDKDLAALIKNDFSGPGNFFFWMLALVAVGATGYIKGFRPIANAFLTLLLIVFLLAANKGGRDFFTSLINQVKGTAQ